MTTRRTFLATSAAALAVPSVLRAQNGPLKVAQVNASPAAEIGWAKQHALGMEAIRAEFGDAVETTVVDNTFIPQDAERVFRQLASGGNRLIFGTSFSLGTPMQKVAPRFPDVAFEHCSGIVHLPNLGTFEAKYYEGTYVAGVAAGHMTRTGRLGFVGGFAIPDIVGPADAFVLGARSVNPEIVASIVFLNSWFDPGREKEAAQALLAQGCDVLLGMTDTGVCVQTAAEAGALSVGYASDLRQFGPESQLTSVVLDWTEDYLDPVRRALNGAWESTITWEGLAAGTVALAPYNEVMPPDVIGALAAVETRIRDGDLHPYAGPISDVDGTLRVPEGEVLSDADIRAIDWLVEGMSGRLG